MNETRIVGLRLERGWTQEKLATESGLGVRTIQRIEAGKDASLETISLIADSFGVPMHDLFVRIEDENLTNRVDSLEHRVADQQAKRDNALGGWRWLFIGAGIILSVLGLLVPQIGSVLFFAFWFGGFFIFVALRRLIIDPHLDAKFPLSKRTAPRKAKR
ncbi:MAG TPA: helix-turn-helix transcriptional regulator [Galbitalea sp.]